MQAVLSAEHMRLSDARTIQEGTDGKTLMGRAAAALAEKGRFQEPVGILCGSGGNGGDGYALALLLKARGLSPVVYRISDKASFEGAYFLEQCRREQIPLRFYEAGEELGGYATLVDCLLGTGFKGKPAPLMEDAIGRINASGAFVIAADISSGLDSDSGLGEAAVRADQTIVIGSYKPGHFLGRAKDLRGELILADIGILPVAVDAWQMEEAEAADCIPPRLHYSHKGKYGYTALVGGSLSYSGAPRLAAMAAAAMRSGAGVAVAAVPESLCPLLLPLVLESTIFPLAEGKGGELRFQEAQWASLCERVTAMAFGMGLGRGPDVQKALSYVLGHFGGRLILDADGLYALSRIGWEGLKESRAQVLLTPHLGEASRLLGVPAREIETAPLFWAKKMAREGDCSVLLKGSSTLVTDGQESWIVDRGCPGMATAGSGDVLSGVLAALLGYGEKSLARLGAAGAYLCGMAGERAQLENGPSAMTAGDTARQIAQAVRRLELIRDRAVIRGTENEG